MKQAYYQREGRRFVAVSHYDSQLLDALPLGDHLISIYPGGHSRRYAIKPELAPMIAAARVAESAVVTAIVENQRLKPSREPITDRQQALWRELAESFDQTDYPLIRPAAQAAAEAAVAALQAEAEKLLNNPTVRSAYERFLFLAELAGDTNGTDPN